MSATASNYSTASISIQPTGRAAGFWRLAWKEYRTARTFWLAIAVLVALIQWLKTIFSDDLQNTLDFIFNFAMGAPAFFAVGCAGSMFAAEKEEGTFEFLRAAPISARQVLASKLMVAVLGAITMLVVSWPLALYFSGNRFPSTPNQMQGMWSLWTVATLGAISWGTLFSLLGARPLVAVVLAILATTTCTHGLAWMMRASTNYGMEWLSYWRAAPWNALISLAVLAVDVGLGLRWLDGRAGLLKSAAALRRKKSAQISHESENERSLLRVRRSRIAMLTRLLWQHVRQSGLLITLMFAVFLATSGLYLPWLTREQMPDQFAFALPWIMALVASLMGSMVFLADQSQYRYRYFVEHNVPPRYVWFTRHVLWILAIAIAPSIICNLWLNYKDFGSLWVLTGRFGRLSSPPPLGVGLAFVVVAYSSGQLMSMLIRSGVMAGFFGLLLSAVLCGWVLLMHTMRISYLWSLAPIPAALMLASWLWAPRWITERRSWVAYAKLAAVVLIPMAALVVAAPIYRVHQVPLVQPGFDVAQFVAANQANMTEGAAAATLYRQADKLYMQHPIDFNGTSNPEGQALDLLTATNRQYIPGKSEWGQISPTDRTLSDNEIQWLDANQQVIDLLVEASQRNVSQFVDPSTFRLLVVPIDSQHGLIALLVASARQLETEGKFDEALDRYFTALKVTADLNVLQQSYDWPSTGFTLDFNRIFFQITRWAANQGQNQERIREAISRLTDLNVQMLHLDDIVKSNFILTQVALSGRPNRLPDDQSDEANSERIFFHHWNRSLYPDEVVWFKFMPWENDRAIRMLNLLANTALSRLTDIQEALNSQNSGKAVAARANQINDFLASISPIDPSVIFQKLQKPKDDALGNYSWWQLQHWLSSTVPNLRGFGDLGLDACRQTVEFEARRRGTMLVLAVEAYRLEHHKLPDSLDDLRGYFKTFPVDPYSGLDFRYFPNGAPTPSVDAAAGQSDFTPSYAIPSYRQSAWPPFSRTAPALWCLGPNLRVDWMPQAAEPSYQSDKMVVEMDWAANANSHVARILTYRYKNSFDVVPDYLLWGEGIWFPIPEGQK